MGRCNILGQRQWLFQSVKPCSWDLPGNNGTKSRQHKKLRSWELFFSNSTTCTYKSKLPFRPFTKKGKSASSTTTFGCKVVLAKRNGKSFNELNQRYISLNEESAIVGYVTDKVEEKWGEIVLVAGNGLAIQDEEGTRG